jgi:hypothetical protein
VLKLIVEANGDHPKPMECIVAMADELMTLLNLKSLTFAMPDIS